MANKREYYGLFILGAATFWLALQIGVYIPDQILNVIPDFLVVPLIGGLALIVAKYIGDKSGFYVI